MADKTKNLDPKPDANRDPISGEPGAHPVGVAGGGTGGAVAGAAIGMAVAGPVGAVIGGAIGTVAGAAAGKGAAEAVNPTIEDSYWRENHKSRPYFRQGSNYEDYEPGYRYGWETASRPEYAKRSFTDIEPDLERNWATYRGPRQTAWRDVRNATQDAFDRVRTRTAGAAAGAADAARDTKAYAGDKVGSIWEQMKGDWKQFRGSVKEKWGKLTDDDLDQIGGHREKLMGKLQERYGEAKWREADVEKEIRGLRR